MRGKKLLQVSGILLIVFYGLGILISCISVFSLIGIQAGLESQTYGLSSYVVNFGSIWVSFIVSVIVTLFGLTVGILGVTMCKQQEKAKLCMAMGIVLLILTVIERVIFIVCLLSLSSKIGRFYSMTAVKTSSDVAAVMSMYTVSAFIGMFVALVTPLLYTIGAALYSKSGSNMNGPYNNGNIGSNQYPQNNNGNGQYPKNQYPNNQNNQNDYRND